MIQAVPVAALTVLNESAQGEKMSQNSFHPMNNEEKIVKAKAIS